MLRRGGKGEMCDELFLSFYCDIFGETFLSLFFPFLLSIAALYVSNCFIKSAKQVSRDTKLVKSSSSLFFSIKRMEFGNTNIADSFFICWIAS